MLLGRHTEGQAKEDDEEEGDRMGWRVAIKLDSVAIGLQEE